eukprot:12638543-Prorocentrum_lima.AAC.1
MRMSGEASSIGIQQEEGQQSVDEPLHGATRRGVRESPPPSEHFGAFEHGEGQPKDPKKCKNQQRSSSQE